MCSRMSGDRRCAGCAPPLQDRRSCPRRAVGGSSRSRPSCRAVARGEIDAFHRCCPPARGACANSGAILGVPPQGIVTVTKYGRIPGGRRDWRHDRRDHQLRCLAVPRVQPQPEGWRSWLSAAFSSPTRQCDAGARNLPRVQVFVRIQGVQHYLWRAVDQNGVVLDILVQPRRDANAAKRFFRRF